MGHIKCLPLIVLLATGCLADVYLHNPRGSNDRNCERNVNRNNGNRLFDSQNNAKGGYACPRAVGGPEKLTERMFFYEGSLLPIEWTNQHGCGSNSKVNCEIIIQYACEDTLDPEATFRAQNGQSAQCSADNTNTLDTSLGCVLGTPRDGTPRDSNDAATDRIPNNRASAIPSNTETRRFGMHESYDFYKDCNTRGRNRGLFTADQNVRRNDATGTRQNPNGNRNGLECPEERDYYPYWHPSPWRDVAVISNLGPETIAANGQTPQTSRCNYYKANSQNVKAMGECVPMGAQGTGAAGVLLSGQAAEERKTQINNRNGGRRWYNNNAKPALAAGATDAEYVEACKANEFKDSCFCAVKRGETVQWVESRFARKWAGNNAQTQEVLAAPDCIQTQFSRINQLGNSASDDGSLQPEAKSDGSIPQGTNANRYIWKVPNTPHKACVLRLRYNISTADYVAWKPDGSIEDDVVTAKDNGKTKSPVKQDPYVSIKGLKAADADDTNTPEEFLSLALNTNQYGRTFQDRSYVFEIRKRPTDIPASEKIINLNVRGKRGNIVQTYPAVEYDFVPNDIQAKLGDHIHMQWTGSDYNPRRGCNNGEGGPPDPNTAAAAKQNSRADRSNIVEMASTTMNLPRDLSGKSTISTGLFPDLATARKFAYLEQSEKLKARSARCLTQAELNNIQNKNQRENHPLNCAKLNAADTPYFNQKPVKMTKKGKYKYFSTRNNNFSNRDQTGKICVGLSKAECAATDNPAVLAAQPTPAPVEVVISDPGKQISADQINQDEAVLAPPDPVAQPAEQEKDNDALGDGEAESCEAMQWQVPLFEKLTTVEQAGLAAGLFFVGGLTALLGVYVYQRQCAGRAGGHTNGKATAGGGTAAAAASVRAAVGAGGKGLAAHTKAPPKAATGNWLDQKKDTEMI